MPVSMMATTLAVEPSERSQAAVAWMSAPARAGKAVDRLSDVLQCPQLIEAWIVGLLDRMDDEVGLGVEDVGATFQPPEKRVGTE